MILLTFFFLQVTAFKNIIIKNNKPRLKWNLIVNFFSIIKLF